jgi:hypothetical protein
MPESSMSSDDQNTYNKGYNNDWKETTGDNGNNSQTNIQHPELQD